MFGIFHEREHHPARLRFETFAQLRFDLKPNSRLRSHPVKKIAENMIKLSDIY